MVRSTWVLSILILMLPACLPRSRARIFTVEPADCLCPNLDLLDAVECPPSVPAVTQERAQEEVDYKLLALTLEAKFNDIPIPFGSEPIPDFFMQDSVGTCGIVFGYTNTTEISKLYDFFKSEYVSLGWRFMGGISSIETLLTFEKPDRVSVVSLRALENSTALIITICPKNSERQEEV